MAIRRRPSANNSSSIRAVSICRRGQSTGRGGGIWTTGQALASGVGSSGQTSTTPGAAAHGLWPAISMAAARLRAG